MKTIYHYLCKISILILFAAATNKSAYSQCGTLSATAVATESRCTATGTISVIAQGGATPELYQYRISAGPVTTGYTNSNFFAALPPGIYTVLVKDVTANCSITLNNIVVAGNYSAPTIMYSSTGITCENGNNGTIFVTSQTGGRAPFQYEIINPSPANVGTVSSNGSFTGLVAGVYTIRLTDSCGGIQTRNQRVNDYTWSILPSSSVTKSGCNEITVNVNLTNSLGNNSPHPIYNGFQYGISKFPGDTTWFTTPNFSVNIGNYRNVTVVVKDGCGTSVKSFSWADTTPTVGATVATSNLLCTTFTATVTGQANLNAAFTQYCLYDLANVIQIAPCQSSNIFANIPYGSYTIRITESCYDTTITRVVAASRPVPSVRSSFVLYGYACNTFTAQVQERVNLTNPVYQLFDATNATQIRPDQTNPVFENIPYGSYCIRTVNDPACYDTTIVRCFTGSKPAPNVINPLTITDRVCGTFTVTASGLTNFDNPVYQLINTVTSTQFGANQTTPSFTNVPVGSYCLNIINDPACYDTTISRCFTVSGLVPSVSASVTVNMGSCNNNTISISGQTNLTNAQYSLYDGDNNLVIVPWQSSPSFTGVSYGNFCMRIKADPACYDTTIVRCFTINRPVPAISASVIITDITCGTFTATVTGQTNVNNPAYTLYDATNTTIVAGPQAGNVFTLVPLGSYCVRLVNDPACYDTTIVRCFNVNRPTASVADAVGIGNMGCTGFSATITGQVNLTNPTYTLYDQTNATIIQPAQSSAVFNNVPYGSYCIRIENDPACFDTTIVRCFSANRPNPTMDPGTEIFDRSCTTFSIRITVPQNVFNVTYQLFDATNNTSVSGVQATNEFLNIPYGSYCVRMVNDPACYDTTLVRCFDALRLVPTLPATVTTSNKTCATFTADLSGGTNLTNATYQLFDATNSTAIGMAQVSATFNNVPYGSYCIRMVNDAACYDTTIVRCFNENPPVGSVSISSLSAAGTCNLVGETVISVSITGGTTPLSIKVFSPANIQEVSYTGSIRNVTLPAISTLPSGFQYKVVVTDACGNKDSAMVTPVNYFINRDINKTTKCPSGGNPDGTGDIFLEITENIGGDYYSKIIKKDGVTTNILPTTSANFGRIVTFIDLAPGTYIIESAGFSAFNCHNPIFDTVIVPPYTYPNLANSKGFICESGLQSIGSTVIGGAQPFQYQIFGSLPVVPSINTAFQANPVFDINNGTTYAMVRLRVLDACGNASINDVGFVPFATPIIESSNDCFGAQTVLSVDTVANATYTWYKRTYNPVDSILLTTGGSYTIPFLSVADTGTYICVTSLNDGCIIRYSYRTITGLCKASVGNWVWLDNPGGLNYNGVQDPGELGMENVTVRLIDNNGVQVANTQTDANGFYQFTDIEPGNYQLQVIPPSGYGLTINTNTLDDEQADNKNGSDFDQSTQRSYTFNLSAGESEMDIDAGLLNLSAVPVKLESFTARPVRNSASLQWNVSMEDNVWMYEVQHSTDGFNFEALPKIVPATKKPTYHFTHDNPSRGINYYRLRIVDKDGSRSFSEIRAVSFGSTEDFTIFPNPAVEYVNIKLPAGMINSAIVITVLDMTGKRIQNKAVPVSSQIERLDIRNLPNGKYVLLVKNNHQTLQRILTVSKK